MHLWATLLLLAVTLLVMAGAVQPPAPLPPVAGQAVGEAMRPKRAPILGAILYGLAQAGGHHHHHDYHHHHGGHYGRLIFVVFIHRLRVVVVMSHCLIRFHAHSQVTILPTTAVMVVTVATTGKINIQYIPSFC